MTPRAVVLCLVLLIATAGVQVGSRREQIPARETFASFPDRVAEWRGGPSERFDQQVLTVLGVDDYITRVYAGSGQDSVGFYVGYYQSQRQGSKLHSPIVCLPGAGWVMNGSSSWPFR